MAAGGSKAEADRPERQVRDRWKDPSRDTADRRWQGLARHNHQGRGHAVGRHPDRCQARRAGGWPGARVGEARCSQVRPERAAAVLGVRIENARFQRLLRVRRHRWRVRPCVGQGPSPGRRARRVRGTGTGHGRSAGPEAYVPVPAGDPEEREAVLAELAALQTEVEDLADQLRAAKTGLAKRVVQHAIDKAAAADDAARARLAMLVPEAQPASYADLLADDDFHERWINRELTTTELTDLHDMFAAYFESVTISPPSRPPKELDPGRIKVQWREGRPPAVDPRPMESDTVFKSESDRSVSVTRVA